MNQHRFATSGAEEARRAMLRDRVLIFGRRLGLSTHTVIALTEQLAHRSWKRCTAPQLLFVLGEYRRLVEAGALERPDGKPYPAGADRRTTRRNPDVAHH